MPFLFYKLLKYLRNVVGADALSPPERKEVNNINKRKSIRISEYDYSKEGYYYITICTKDRKKILSKINLQCLEKYKLYENIQQNSVGADASVCPNKKIIILSTIGKIVENCLTNINKIHKEVFLDNYIIMPNHIHAIIKIESAGGQRRPPLHKIIQEIKSVTTRKCFKYGYKQIWQRNYYEHIIRNEKEYYEICKYIYENPIKNEEDI